MDTLRAATAAVLASLWVDVDVALPYAAGELLARVRERGTVDVEYRERDVAIRGRVAPALAGELEAVAARWAVAERARPRRRRGGGPGDGRRGRQSAMTDGTGWLRRAGSGRPPDGSLVRWSVAEGAAVDAGAGRSRIGTAGCGTAGLLERDTDGRFARLELATAAGMLTLPPVR